jgi:hypothetical protein
MDLVSVEGEPIFLAGGKFVTRPDIVAPVSSVVLFSFCGFAKVQQRESVEVRNNQWGTD